MKSILMSIFALVTFTTFAQDNKAVKEISTEKRPIRGSFSAIDVSDGIDIFLTQGIEDSLTITATDKKYLSRFKTDVINGTLRISYDRKGIKWVASEKGKLTVYLSFKMVDKLYASSGSTITASNNLELGNVEMKFNSGSVFKGSMNAKILNIEESSGSVISLSGKAEKIKIIVSSGSNFKGFDLAVDYCDAKSSSGSGVHITVNKELNANASSGGGIYYKGDALIRDLSISSGGAVKKS